VPKHYTFVFVTIIEFLHKDHGKNKKYNHVDQVVLFPWHFLLEDLTWSLVRTIRQNKLVGKFNM